MKSLILMVLLSGSVPVLTAQNLDRMKKNKRESQMIVVAKEIVMKYGPDYYRKYKRPVVERHQVPPKGELNPTGEGAGRIFYQVIFLYDKTQESLEHDFAARVTFQEDTGKPTGMFFGNGWGRKLPENWRDETVPVTEQNPYQEVQLFPIYDYDNPDPNQEPKNKDELIRKGYERRERGQWVKTRPDVPPGKRKK
ncbi:MAG: hypothetical protein LBL24_00025 [Bacteroidales bacterium]|nr:hypothetical protein [Bacteroidales bacterium]